MRRFIARWADQITGSLSFFDRVLFRGMLGPLSRAESAVGWLWYHGVPLTEFGNWAERQSKRLKEHAEAWTQRVGRPYLYVPSPKTSKEHLVRKIVERDGIREGLVCVLSCVEPCMSYDVRRNRERKRIDLVRVERKCLFLYFYLVDREFGLMHVRLQTWMPYDIQVCINGREWLARRMDREGLSYERRDNCFVRLDNPVRTQDLADRLLATKWAQVFDHFAQEANPLLRETLQGLGYYWTVRQGEYATDVMFQSPQALAEVYPALVHHAITTFGSEDVLRFLGQRFHGNFKGEVFSDLRRRPEGIRIRHTVCENSIKMYDKFGWVLRIEMTINNPRRFKAYRPRRRDGKVVREWLPMRKGVADMRRRVEISRAANGRYLDALATIPQAEPAAKVLDPVSRPVLAAGVRSRALRPVAPQETDRLAAVLRGEFLANGVRNRDLVGLFFPEAPEDPSDRRRRAGHVTRFLRLLQAHELLRKLTGTHRYLVTQKGIAVVSTAIQLRRTDVTTFKDPGKCSQKNKKPA